MTSLAKAEMSLRLAFDALGRRLQDAENQAARNGDDLMQEAADLSHRDTTKAENVRDRCEFWMEQLPVQFQWALAVIQEPMEQVASMLNLRAEDYMIEPPRGPVQPRLCVKTEEHIETRQVKQPGLWGTVKRTLGAPFGPNWGYETHTYRRTRLDCDDFRRRVDGAVRGQLSWVSATRSEIIEAIQARLATLTGEITRRQAIIQQQLASAAKHDERRQAVSRLKALAEAVSHGLTSLSPAAEPEPFDNPTAPGEMTAIEVPRFVEALARLTDRYVRQRFVVLRDSILARVGKRLRGAERRVLLWSFEASSLERFLTRFWFDALQGPLAPGSVLELIQDVGPFEAIGVGKEVTEGYRQPSLMTETKQFLSKASTVFLL